MRFLARYGKGLVLASLLLLLGWNEWAGTAALGIILGTFAVAMSYPLGLMQTSAPGTIEVTAGVFVVERGGTVKRIAVADVASRVRCQREGRAHRHRSRGAALALRVAGAPRERVRIAAEGAADPRVRVALEAIADDADDEKLEKALRRLRRA